jgi:hypothetical protein
MNKNQEEIISFFITATIMRKLLHVSSFAEGMEDSII